MFKLKSLRRLSKFKGAQIFKQGSKGQTKEFLCGPGILKLNQFYGSLGFLSYEDPKIHNRNIEGI